MSEFKDYFSGHAALYAQYRPQYPDKLFQWIASKAPSRQLVWDCATGNGQAAVGLSKYFDTVIATDASDKQIAEAEDRPNIHYEVANAEHSPLQDHAADVVTVAAAAHWFDLGLFYKEVRRVLKPGGLLVLWAYNVCQITPDVQSVMEHLYHDIIGLYWPAERHHVDVNYSDFDFPFQEIVAPNFEMTVDYTLEQLVGYLHTWSAVQRYMTATGKDPLDLIMPDLTKAWGDPLQHRAITWPIFMRAGYGVAQQLKPC